MSSSSITKVPVATFVCACDEESMRIACKGLPFYKEHKGKPYCVLHYPGNDKSADFDEVLESKIRAEDFNFSGVWFPDEVDFSNSTFTTAASFASATFSAKA